MTAEPWTFEPRPDYNRDVLICDCGAEDWRRLIVMVAVKPSSRIAWECRDCGAMYDTDGVRVSDGR